ncbi:hypothetical protein [Leptolyngbya ohadii]|uniref:hypothetical protein n=1 Tax=Leptolyngbya ohadii TaxID=1962290 RepID=UPI000B5A17C0|nr:hypothetical protein [Leptolyngbya ohadii]
MQKFTAFPRPAFPPPQSEPEEVLGNSIVLDLDQFPELQWISRYLIALHRLQADRDRLAQDIRAIEQEGDVYFDQWIEPYVKTKNGKQYTYHQLRWLTGEYKKSGQPKVKTKHLSHQQVGEVRAAIERGQQVKALQEQQSLIDAQIVRLRQLVRGTGRRMKRLSHSSLAGRG